MREETDKIGLGRRINMLVYSDKNVRNLEEGGNCQEIWEKCNFLLSFPGSGGFLFPTFCNNTGVLKMQVQRKNENGVEST